MKTLLAVLLLITAAGCASGPYMMPDSSDVETSASGHAFAGHSMTFRKEQPDRQEVPNWDFYYKHCSTNGDETHYSKTSYDCNGPLAR